MAILRNLASAAVALKMVLGSTPAEIPATQSLNTHGPRASRLAEVTQSFALCVSMHSIIGLDCYVAYHAIVTVSPQSRQRTGRLIQVVLALHLP